MSDNPDACRCLLQGKGIGGEFRDECAALIREGMGPSAIIDTLTVKYQKRPHLNPKKVLRIPSESTLKGLRASMYNGPGSEIKDNTQLLAWCSGRMCTTKADFDKLTEEDDNKLLVLATFCREVEVDVEPALPQLGVGVDVEVVAPEVPPYGTHHSKLFFLQYDRGIRIIIHTANLVYCDFNNKSQSVYVQDFPLRGSASDRQDAPAALPNDFEGQLLTYVDHLGLSTNYAAKLKAAISAHDYTYARGRLAMSVPSKPWQHQGADFNAYGHHRVREILADESIDDRFRDAPVVAQCSSLGTMSQKYVDQLLGSFAASSGAAPFKLVWPSVSEVQHSLEGWFGGGSVCATRDRLSKPAVQSSMHAWGGDMTGRQVCIETRPASPSLALPRRRSL